ncbi:MAG: siderophore-interacting protein [Pseudomonadota bacterium]
MNKVSTTRASQGIKVPRLLTVKEAFPLTPNMIRVTFAGEELAGIPAGREGANCKILLPAPGQSRAAFAEQLQDGPRPVIRTYTMRHFREDLLEMDIDFVVHGDAGPASAWAASATPGSFCGFRGPSGVKVEQFVADWYLVAADMSALPVAAATLEAMPRDAKGVAIFEITTADDRQAIDVPPGFEVHWLLHRDPHVPSRTQVDFIRSMRWREGRVQTCIAGESNVIRALREFLHKDKQLPRADTYISGYWKIGLVEDEHQKIKRLEAA